MNAIHEYDGDHLIDTDCSEDGWQFHCMTQFIRWLGYFVLIEAKELMIFLGIPTNSFFGLNLLVDGNYTKAFVGIIFFNTVVIILWILKCLGIL